MFPIRIIEDPQSNSTWFVNVKNITKCRYFNVLLVDSIEKYLEGKYFLEADCIFLLKRVTSMIANTTKGRDMARYMRDIIRNPTYEEYCLLERYLRKNKLQYNKQRDELIQMT